MRSPAVLALVLASMSACSDDGAPRSRVRVGALDGTDATVGAVIEDDVTVYVCGGPTTFGTHTRWFRDGAIGEDDGPSSRDRHGTCRSLNDGDAAGAYTCPMHGEGRPRSVGEGG